MLLGLLLKKTVLKNSPGVKLENAIKGKLGDAIGGIGGGNDSGDVGAAKAALSRARSENKNNDSGDLKELAEALKELKEDNRDLQAQLNKQEQSAFPPMGWGRPRPGQFRPGQFPPPRPHSEYNPFVQRSFSA